MDSDRQSENNGIRLATRRDLFRLLAFLDEKLPHLCDIYDHVLTHLLTTNPNYRVHFLCDPTGEYVAIVGTKRDWRRLLGNNETQRTWLLSAWAIDESTKAKAYRSIKDIDWITDEFVFTGLQYEPDPAITALFVSHGRELTLHRMNLYVMDRQAALTTELSTPDDVYVKSLETSHSSTVYDHWDYKDTTVVESVADSVVESPSAGVFLKETDELVSWMTNFLPTGLSQLHTLEQFRRRGYAAYVIRYLSKRTAQSGYVPYAIISPGNKASENCFINVGLESVGPYHICEAKFDF